MRPDPAPAQPLSVSLTHWTFLHLERKQLSPILGNQSPAQGSLSRWGLSQEERPRAEGQARCTPLTAFASLIVASIMGKLGKSSLVISEALWTRDWSSTLLILEGGGPPFHTYLLKPSILFWSLRKPALYSSNVARMTGSPLKTANEKQLCFPSLSHKVLQSPVTC